MDVGLVVQQMRLDAFAAQVSDALAAQGVPHALLKGPTTARWLYPENRLYRDVDLLLPASAIATAVTVLTAAEVAAPHGGALGEVASHAQLLRSPTGIELDLHVTLPLMPPGTDPWAALEPHLSTFVLDTAVVPALDEVARCVVLALHALGNGPNDAQSIEDLRRARQHPHLWPQALRLSARLGVAPLVTAALTLVEGGELPGDLPLDARLRLVGGSGEAYQIDRLLGTPLRRLPGAVLREVFPSPAFMRYDDPALTITTMGLLKAYARRGWWLVRRTPRAALERRRLAKAAPRAPTSSR